MRGITLLLIILNCVCTLYTVVLHVCMWMVPIHSYNPRDRYRGFNLKTRNAKQSTTKETFYLYQIFKPKE